MSADLLIRGARVSDGTGLPAFTADVAVRNGTIEKVGRLRDASGAVTIEADGLDLVPGFVDVHTHYDAQLHFDSSASPSSWHGVTTVVTGNCGFTLAPSKADDLDWLMEMLAKVEGMSVDALRAGVDFTGGTLGEFLDGLEGRIGVNMASYVGHAAVRRWVMGEEASSRAATDGEILQMKALVHQAMQDGAIGLSTSQRPSHADHLGRPVPPNLASDDEIVALASVLADYSEGVLEHLCRSYPEGYDAADRRLLANMARESGGKPLHANILSRLPSDPDAWMTCLDVIEGFAREGLRVYPMACANPKGLHIALSDTILFNEFPHFRSVLALPLPERKAALADPTVRDQLRADLQADGRQFVFSWEQMLVVNVHHPEHVSRVGRSVAEIARARGSEYLDTFLDLALEDDLYTVFLIDRPIGDEDRVVIGQLLRHPLTMPGSSDGGAHVNMFCGADYTTRVLTDFVSDDFPFEEAVRRLSALPAATLGMWNRGTIRPGAAADLVLLEREKLAVGEARFVHDLPAGAGRLIWDQAGYHSTIVNGQAIVRDGVATGATPGRVLRFNRESTLV